MNFMEDKDRPGFFKDYHASVRKSVSNDQFNEFSKLTTDEDRVRFLLKIPAVHDIDIKTFYKSKSEREALEKKEAGNKAFIHKNNLEALKLYSQAVVKAPVPSEENADPKKMTLYAICLANRSASLFHLKEFYFCIKDIDEALEHHYPKELKYKLYKRKGRLMVSYKRHEDALDSFRQALKWLDWAKMERDKRIDQQNEIQRWIRLFQGAKVVKNAPWEEVELFPKVPELAGTMNEKFPALSQKVSVEYQENRGRFVVARGDIQPGDTICVEKPYASVLLYEVYGTHCQNCFILTKAAIPCKNCAGVLFCSSECRDSAYFHKVECTILTLLQGSGMSINCFLALRMLTQTPLSFFMNMRDQLVDEDPKTEFISTPVSMPTGILFGWIEKNDSFFCIHPKRMPVDIETAVEINSIREILERNEQYQGSDFLRVFNLVRHSNKRTPEDFFHRTLMSVFMVKTLKKTKYFIEYANSNALLWKPFRAENLSDAEIFVGGLLLRFLQIVQFNAHEVSEFSMPAPKTMDNATNESIGAAIYPSLALFNHSCQSAMVRYFSGNRVIAKAVRPLAEGELVPENYGPAFTTKPKAQRRVTLADRYWFECDCEPCEKNWPMFKEMDNSILLFKCHKCKAAISVNINTHTPFFACNNCNDQTNILSALKNLQNTEQTFKAACKEMQVFNLQKAENLLIENLNQLNSSLYPPYKDYHLTQEALMRCCLCMGNRKIKTVDNKHLEKNH